MAKHMFCSQTSSQRIGLVGHLFFKCDEMRLSWFFLPSKHQSHSPENIFEFVFKRARSALYRARQWKSLLGKVLNKILSSLSQYCLKWRSGNENGPEKKGPKLISIDSGWNLFFVFLFFSFLFFLFFFSSPFRLLIYSFLVILVLFCSFIQTD